MEKNIIEIKKEIIYRFGLKDQHSRAVISGNKKNRFREIIYSREQYQCIYCIKKPGNTLDHVRPVHYGGQHRLTNIVAACVSCNRLKGQKDVISFVEKSFSSKEIFDILKRVLDHTEIELNKKLWYNYVCKKNDLQLDISLTYIKLDFN